MEDIAVIGIVLAALGGTLRTEMPAAIVHEPTRVDSAIERSAARCRNLEIVVERPLASEASDIANMASIAVNGRSLGDPTLRPFLTFLSDLDSLYQLRFTCGHNGVIGIYVS